jgi:hypothetical protein
LINDAILLRKKHSNLLPCILRPAAAIFSRFLFKTALLGVHLNAVFFLIVVILQVSLEKERET